MSIIHRTLKSADRWRGYLIVSIIALILVTALNLISPIIVGKLLRTLTSFANNEITLSTARHSIWIMAAALLGVYLLRILLQFFNNYFAHIAAWRFVASMRVRIYGHLQTLSLKYYNDKQTGQIMARIMEDTVALENLIAHALPDIAISILMFGGVLTILFTMNPILALLTCIPLPFIVFISFFMRKTRKHFRERKMVSAELMGILQDNISGIKEIQVFNRENYETERVKVLADLHATKTLRGIFWVSIMNPIMGLVQGLGTICIILFGGLLVLSGSTIAPDITVFLLYLGLLYTPVANLGRIVEDTQDAMTSARRVFEVLDSTSEVQNRKNAREVINLRGNVQFKKVSFSYTPDIPVLNNVSFKAKSGQMIAIVGPTGSGKTTMLSLLTRFYDVTAGAITIDGIDIRDMTLSSLRKHISIVLQDVFLFNGTIAQNIAYGRNDDVTMEEIIEVAKTAAVHEFIDSLPQKYETIVGERGTRLSGGQKQRIAIARALLRKSPILILDEATSAVDNETEREIQRAISQIAGSRTLLVIAHRLTTIERADKILYLENGRIIESGSHTELIAQNGAYANMKK